MITPYPLEPDRAGMAELGRAALDRAISFVEGLPGRPGNTADETPAELIREMLAPPPESPGEMTALLDRVERAAAYAFETAGPGYLAYIPGGGIFASAVVDLYARVTNRYVGLAAAAPALVALEQSVVRWLADLCGLPEGSGGLLVSGGSIANLSAVIAARHAGLGEQLARGTLYLSAHTHQSVAKAARLAGIPAAGIRVVPCTPELRMDLAAATEMIAADRTAGRHPFLLVGSAGTTNTGAVDPLPELAALARQEGLWFHVDAAYGGMFRLTDRGRERTRGVEQADSVTLDPHKTLFLPYGTGALVVRDPARLAAAHESGGHYLQDLAAGEEVPDYAHLGPELTRDLRGLRVWLPLHLYGVAAFRAALDEKLDLAELAYGKLAAEPLLEVPWRPELSTVAFRMRAAGPGIAAPGRPEGSATPGQLQRADAASRELLERINASGRVFLSSTVIDDRYTLRLCIVSHRTHADRVTEAIDIITSAAHDI